MQQSTGYILLGKEELHYLKMGNGKKLLFAFHGYSNDSGLFSPFSSYLSDAYTIISFDLPYHGASKWKGKPLTKEDLATLIQLFLIEYQVQQLSLMGYSLGGRFCLAIAELFPQKIERILLLSSDGLSFNFFYFFSTHTYLGEYFLKSLVSNAAIYLSVLHLMNRVGLLSTSLYNFATGNINSKHKREFLRNVWLVTRHIRPHIAKLKKIINKNQIPVFVFNGEYDRIITTRQARSFVKGLGTAQLIILKCGHRTINSISIPEMAKCLTS